MRLVSIIAVPVVAAGLSVTGMYLAPTSGAECEARNGTMLCTDPPAPGDPSPPRTTSYPCVVDAWCDNFAFDVVVGDGPAEPGPPPSRRPRPEPRN